MDDMHTLPRDGAAAEIATLLTRLQGDRTDADFAAVLGCTRVHWSHIRAGRRRLSYAMAKRVGRLFPEVLSILMRDLVAPEPPTTTKKPA